MKNSRAPRRPCDVTRPRRHEQRRTRSCGARSGPGCAPAPGTATPPTRRWKGVRRRARRPRRCGAPGLHAHGPALSCRHMRGAGNGRPSCRALRGTAGRVRVLPLAAAPLDLVVPWSLSGRFLGRLTRYRIWISSFNFHKHLDHPFLAHLYFLRPERCCWGRTGGNDVDEVGVAPRPWPWRAKYSARGPHAEPGTTGPAGPGTTAPPPLQPRGGRGAPEGGSGPRVSLLRPSRCVNLSTARWQARRRRADTCGGGAWTTSWCCAGSWRHAGGGSSRR